MASSKSGMVQCPSCKKLFKPSGLSQHLVLTSNTACRAVLQDDAYMPGLEYDTSDSEDDELDPTQHKSHAPPTACASGPSRHYSSNASAGPSGIEATPDPILFSGDFFGAVYSEEDYNWQEPDDVGDHVTLEPTLQAGMFQNWFVLLHIC